MPRIPTDAPHELFHHFREGDEFYDSDGEFVMWVSKAAPSSREITVSFGESAYCTRDSSWLRDLIARQRLKLVREMSFFIPPELDEDPCIQFNEDGTF